MAASYADPQESFDIFDLAKCADFEIWHEHNAHVFIRSSMARDIIPSLRNWDYNRCLNLEHKNTIKDNLYQQQFPVIHGEICLVCDSSYRPVVINGQHRLTAITEIINERPSYDIKLQFRIIVVMDIDNITSINNVVVEKIKEIYKIINMSLPIDQFKIKDMKAEEIANAMTEHDKLKEGIVRQLEGRTVHKPRITFKHLKDSISWCLPDDCKHIDTKVFVRKAIAKNEEFSEMSASEIYGRTTPAKEKMAHFEKAGKRKFYLNLDGVAAPEKWIMAILAEM
jgi:hypothetical protein